VHVIAKRIVAGLAIGPQNHCVICGRGLTDEESIARGIGSECWQDVLSDIYTQRNDERAIQKSV
jgi:hypothetical protein